MLIFGILFIVGLYYSMDQFFWGGPGARVVNEILRQIHIENMELLRNYSLIGLGALLIIGTAGGYLLSRRMLKPIDHVSSLASRISHTNLKERIKYKGPDDEVKRLADTFDDMLGRLEAAFESQKQFIQDASHELRTPIAIAQTNIEVAEMEGRATVKDYKRLMEVLKMSLERMNRLNDNLLLLSEGDQPQMKMAATDIGALLEDIAAESNARARETGVTVELEPVKGETRVMGDALRLKQAVINLVDNAIKYNRPGGTIKLSSQTDDAQVVMQVQDSGIGISQADQQRIFDRFYRVDKSRSRAQGGSGLGLAIVKKIIEDHGGSISLESTPDVGSTFSITLPRHTG
jgi:signal transduction histidine kinase